MFFFFSRCKPAILFGVVQLSSLLYSWGKLRHRRAWCSHVLHLAQPGLKPSGLKHHTPMRCQGLPRVQGQSHWSQTLLPPNPFRPHEANSLTEHHRVLGREVKCFLLHSAPVPASLFFVSILAPKEKSTLPGFVLVGVYGWSLPLIVNGAIRPFLYTVSTGVWQSIWRTLYLHSRNMYTKGRAFKAFSFTVISAQLREHAVLRAAKI